MYTRDIVIHININIYIYINHHEYGERSSVTGSTVVSVMAVALMCLLAFDAFQFALCLPCCRR